jgi:hypothetical protein
VLALPVEVVILIFHHILSLEFSGRITYPKLAQHKGFLFSLCDSVLLGWDSGVWFALCLHLCLLQESTSSQNLAALREEGSVGCVLQR